ncbi:hypothetical protein TL16_g02173 [Triparma laevis f. inornata]|uniref:Uncharacterized protein n=1 Tax=Triparma laevis f. inornata TaxID=1714386 RepID=A0A9W6ZU43_9STRA|nr:hypothetical protein TL16_g02173 [Triparma laevis f. inornata]
MSALIEHEVWLNSPSNPPPSDLLSYYQTYTSILTDVNSLTSKYALLTTSVTQVIPPPSAALQVLNRIIKVLSDLKITTESLRTTGNAKLLNDELEDTFATIVKSFAQPNYGTAIAGKIFYAVKPWLFTDSVTFSDLHPPARKSSRFSNLLFLKRLAFNYLKHLHQILTNPQKTVKDSKYYEITGDDNFWDYVYSNNTGNKEYDNVKGAFCETDYEVVKSVNSLLKKVGEQIKTYLNQPSVSAEHLVISVISKSERVEEFISPETLDVDEDGDLTKGLVELKIAVRVLAENLGVKGTFELDEVEGAMAAGREAMG